jgi:ADP-heptose:LPS heptosyltransferase
MWRPEGFAAVADHMIQERGIPVVALPGNAEQAWVRSFLERARSRNQIHLLQDLSIPQMAAVIENSRLLVSNDTGPMHLGPALAIPTLGLFSVGLPAHFRPSGSGDRFLQRESLDRITSGEVIGVIDEMWSNVRSGLQR